jgi:hypothetical protein
MNVKSSSGVVLGTVLGTGIGVAIDNIAMGIALALALKDGDTSTPMQDPKRTIDRTD